MGEIAARPFEIAVRPLAVGDQPLMNTSQGLMANTTTLPPQPTFASKRYDECPPARHNSYRTYHTIIIVLAGWQASAPMPPLTACRLFVNTFA